VYIKSSGGNNIELTNTHPKQTTKRAGNIRQKRLLRKDDKEKVPCSILPHTIEVIKKPLMAKKTDTPMNPQEETVDSRGK
jgi:hypothetical protein